MKNVVKEKYPQMYKSIGFERFGLFELIQKEFNPKTVIYPGCSIHVTPSFCFKHVVYIDKSSLAADFFRDTMDVSDLMNQYKIFKENPYWKFIPKDFQADLGLKKYSFDLLLSLFSGKLIAYCEKYVKVGGLILTNSLFSDNDSIKSSNAYKLLGSIRCINTKYRFYYGSQPSRLQQSKLRQKNNKYEYVDNEEYFVYERIKPKISKFF